jgi:hypothetical protein
MFFNRDADVRKVLTRLRKGQSVSVVGKEKIGKTSLLYFVSDPEVAMQHGFASQKYLFCYVDCKEWADLSEDGCFGRLKAAVEEAILTWEACPVVPPDDAAYPEAHFWLDQTLLLFDQVGAQLVVQLDDFDRLANNERLSLRWLDNLRALSEASGTMTYLVTSRVPLADLQGELSHIAGSPFFGIFWEHEIQAFTSDEARRFLVTRLESVGVVFPDCILTFICGLSRGEPHRLQLAGACAYDVWRENGCCLCEEHCGEIEERFGRELQSASGDSV